MFSPRFNKVPSRRQYDKKKLPKKKAFNVLLHPQLSFVERIEAVERVPSTVHATVVFLLSFFTVVLDSKLAGDPIFGTSKPYYVGLQYRHAF